VEWAFVCAAVDRLIPRDEIGPGALELGVAEYIDRTLQTPYGEGSRWYMQGPFVKAAAEFGYQSKLTPREQYRLGVRGVNAYTQKTYGKDFADLSPADKNTTLKAMEVGTAKGGDSDLKGFFAGFLLKNTFEGFFGDPMYGGNKDMAAWKMIGYPGVRADFIDFADKNARYPFGPVDMHGRNP
jgi:gluconate 2-dehydrogenase gamma chain